MVEHKAGKIGVPATHHVTSYELVVYEHVPLLDPHDFGLAGPKFDPAVYYLTSGEATQKAKVLLRDLRQYAASITKLTGDAHQIEHLQKATAQALVGAQRMYDLLVVAKGTNIFLETERANDHRLMVIPKNPRVKPPPCPV